MIYYADLGGPRHDETSSRAGSDGGSEPQDGGAVLSSSPVVDAQGSPRSMRALSVRAMAERRPCVYRHHGLGYRMAVARRTGSSQSTLPHPPMAGPPGPLSVRAHAQHIGIRSARFLA